MGNQRFGWTGALLVGVMGLNGCSSLMQGEQYVFPRTDEPSAIIRVKNDSTTSVNIMNLNESGCYAGFTPMPLKGDFIEAPVAVDKTIIVDYRRQASGKVCQIFFSFTPQAGATYTLSTGSWSETKTGILPIFTSDQQYCGLGAIKMVGDQKSVEHIQKLRIDTGITCHKFAK